MTRIASPLVIAVMALSACSDRPTAPNDARLRSSNTGAAQLSSNAAHPIAAVPASVTWEARAESLAASRSFAPIVAGRAYGLLGFAQYGAAIAATPDDDAQDGEDDGALSPSPQAHYYVIRGAVAGASAQVLRYVFPLDVAAIEAQVAREGAAGAPGIQSQFARGVAIGRAIGDIVVQHGRADGFANADGTPKVWDPNSLPTGPTFWHMDKDVPKPQVPAGFQFPTMRPYYLTSPSQFRPPPPAADLTAAANEVVAIVNARTPAQVAIAKFWNLSNGTITALGYWDQLAASYIQEFGLSERDSAHLFALMNSAGADATIGCWDAKYFYLVPRPWMVVADDSTNGKMIIGRPNHPSYPSGHSCVSAAAAAVLAEFFPSKTTTLDQQVAEAGISRVYGGIHYFMDIREGQALGRSVAAWAIAYDQDHGLLSAVFPSGTFAHQ